MESHLRRRCYGGRPWLADPSPWLATPPPHVMDGWGARPLR